MDVFSQVVAAPSLAATAFSWDWSAFGDGKLWLALFTFLYIDLLDCTVRARFFLSFFILVHIIICRPDAPNHAP
jgi:hypothetical protein